MEQPEAPTIIHDGLFSAQIAHQVKVKIPAQGPRTVSEITTEALRTPDPLASSIAANFTRGISVSYTVGFTCKWGQRFQDTQSRCHASAGY
jgi:hypothetical protein